MPTQLPPYGLKRTAPPAYEPLTLAETKLYLRVDHTDDDAAILRIIQSAREMAEAHLRRSLITQEWQLDIEGGVESPFYLPRGPVQQVLSVMRLRADGSVLETVSAATYRLHATATHLVLSDTLYDRLRITYRTGYGSAEQIPATIRQGILAHVGALYEGVATGGIPEQCVALYQNDRERSL